MDDVRPKDESFSPEEELYRSVEPSHLDGARVLDAAVEAPACSFNRQKYSAPEEARSGARPEQTCIAYLVAGQLPGPIVREKGAHYEFFLADDPCPLNDPENEAHCEVRIKRAGATYDPAHRPKASVKKLARSALADRMRPYKAR